MGWGRGVAKRKEERLHRAPKARIGKMGSKSPRSGDFSSWKLHFQSVFSGFSPAARSIYYVIKYEPTSYTAILREPKSIAQAAILHYKMYIIDAKYTDVSPAALTADEKYI